MGNVLEFTDLGRSFGNKASVKESGEAAEKGILVLRGPSGSGKSTILRMLARLITADSGEVYLRGIPWLTIPPGSWRRRVQYVSQKPVMFSGTVEENFRLPFSLNGSKDAIYFPDFCQKCMDAAGLSMDLMNQTAQTLSGGEASRVALVRALLVNPEVLLLDEPSAYLDSDSRARVMGLISRWVKEKVGRAIILVSHNEDDLNYLTGVSILDMDKGGPEHE